MTATTFWSADGRPMSAAQFIESLFGELPLLFKDEDELRRLWSEPATRKALLHGLSEKGFGGDPTRGDQQRDQRREERYFRRPGLCRVRPPADHAARTRGCEQGCDRRELRRQAADISRFRALAICRAKASRNWTRRNSARWSHSNTVQRTKPRPPWAAWARYGIRSSGFRGICTRRERARLTRGTCGDRYIDPARRRPNPLADDSNSRAQQGAWLPGKSIASRRMAKEARDE